MAVKQLIDVADAYGVSREALRKRAERARKAGQWVVKVEGLGTVPFTLEGRTYYLTVPDDTTETAAAAAAPEAEDVQQMGPETVTGMLAVIEPTGDEMIPAAQVAEYMNQVQRLMLHLAWDNANLKRENAQVKAENERSQGIVTALNEQHLEAQRKLVEMLTAQSQQAAAPPPKQGLLSRLFEGVAHLFHGQGDERGQAQETISARPGERPGGDDRDDSEGRH